MDYNIFLANEKNGEPIDVDFSLHSSKSPIALLQINDELIIPELNHATDEHGFRYWIVKRRKVEIASSGRYETTLYMQSGAWFTKNDA